MSDCSAGQTARVSSNLHPTSTMAVSRVPSPPPTEVNTPVAENWCYTQVSVEIAPILTPIRLVNDYKGPETTGLVGNLSYKCIQSVNKNKSERNWPKAYVLIE